MNPEVTPDALKTRKAWEDIILYMATIAHPVLSDLSPFDRACDQARMLLEGNGAELLRCFAQRFIDVLVILRSDLIKSSVTFMSICLLDEVQSLLFREISPWHDKFEKSKRFVFFFIILIYLEINQQSTNQVCFYYSLFPSSPCFLAISR